MEKTMSFERRLGAVERALAASSLEASQRARDERRAEWRALFNAILNEHDRLGGDLDGAIRRAVAERYGGLDEDEREQMCEELLLVFQYWGEVDMAEIRADKRNLLPPGLRGGGA
jgi:hypothetical protein